MRVIDLRIILKHLPDDMEVVVEGRGPTRHIQEVRRSTPMTIDHVMPLSRYRPGDKAPGRVHLVGGVGWWEPPPRFEVIARLIDPVGMHRRLRGVGARVLTRRR